LVKPRCISLVAIQPRTSVCYHIVTLSWGLPVHSP